MKKVLAVGPDIDLVGGISNFMKSYLESMSGNQSYQVDYFDTYKVKSRKIQKKSSFSLKEIKASFLVFWSFFKVLASQNFDYVLLNSSSYWGFWEKTALLIIVRFFSKSHIVFLVHGGEFKTFYEKSSVKFLIKLSLNFCQNVCFVSRESFCFFDSILKTNCRYFILPVQPPISLDESIDEYFLNIREKYKWVFLSISVLEDRKRVQDVIDFFIEQSNDDSCLLVCGDGIEKEIIKEKCCSKKIYSLLVLLRVIKNQVFLICQIFLFLFRKKKVLVLLQSKQCYLKF
ncbi:hypothetical protein AB8616_21250 [Marinomonas sp. RS-M-Aa-14]|uniref:hypothetical protein n=1 Tax=Marinomonas sp. RS-M-Aa-14 TaxID=3241169 RepID=UPI003AAE6E83